MHTVYLPRFNFSSKSMDATKATIKSIRGLKADAYKGPFFCTTHAMIRIIIPDAKTPFK